MSSLLVFLVLGMLAVVIFPFIVSVIHVVKLRNLEALTRKLLERVAALEFQKNQVPAATQRSAVMPEVATPAFVPPSTAKSAAVPPPPPKSIPEPAPAKAVPPPPPIAAQAPARPIDWEAFMGVKLFAWIGGFVLFLGVVFLVKYSFENNLITPRARLAIGAIIGLSLVAAGWFTSGKKYRVPGQSLCATGVLVLYADIFAAHTFYNIISLTSAFFLMSIVTVAAFLLAVRMNAQVVVVLGLLGGFLTPRLLETGADNPGVLFGYLALLNTGIAAVAIRKRWDYLVILAAAGTALAQFNWMADFHPREAAVAFVVFLGFAAQFLAIFFIRERLQPPEEWTARASLGTGFAALAGVFCMIPFNELGQRPAFLFSLAFFADIGLLAVAMKRPDPAKIAGSAGGVVFVLLAWWTGAYLSHALLWWALGGYVLFALLHSGFAVWPGRVAATPMGASAASWYVYIPLLSLALLALCVWKNETSLAVWTTVLLVNLIAVGLAWASGLIRALFVALLATIATAALWIVTAPRLAESPNEILGVIAFFGLFFPVAATLLLRKIGTSEANAKYLPSLAAGLPFALLLMLIAKLPALSPTPVFAVALVLAVLLLAFGILGRTSWIAAVALGCTWLVELAWHSEHFSPASAFVPAAWYLLFFLLFAAYPFFSAEDRSPLPWAIGALSAAHFWLIYHLVSSAYPALRTGLLPALFILPYAFGVYFLVKKRGIIPASGDSRLAWQGGAMLLFVSLIFPIQFEREWITLGWALEGLGLLVLFRIVPHNGLRLVGAALLCVAFARLALNPAVFTYHARAPVRIWNWYLYTYGITSLCLLGGARLVRDFQQNEIERFVPKLLYTLGGLLTFLLLNIEIADYFSVGPTLTFSFSGNFARDMTYSIAWALFAFVLLLIGMRKKIPAIRYAGLGLLVITLIKLFLLDLANLSQLYRIGAFIGVAVILIVASFVYQRFLAPQSKGG